MHAEGDTTRYVDWSPPRARLALALTAVMIGGFMSVVLSAVTFPVHQGKGDTDVDLFRKVVRRIQAGESHYDAYQRVFEEYHYPVRSVLNYRTPLHGWLVGNLPSLFWAQAILAAVVMVTALMAYTCLRRHGGAPARQPGCCSCSVPSRTALSMTCIFTRKYGRALSSPSRSVPMNSTADPWGSRLACSLSSSGNWRCPTVPFRG